MPPSGGRTTDPRNATATPERRPRRSLLVLGGALLVALATAAAPAHASPAVIDVDFSSDGLTVEIESSKAISNVIVQFCDGSAHKHEDEFEGEEIDEFEHTEDQVIVAVWVKSGNNHDDEGPQPPSPFDNDGSGEHFPNPDAERLCREIPVFPSGFAWVMATVVGRGGYLVVARRRRT